MADVDEDRFTARVVTPQGTWRKVRVLVVDGAAHVFAPDSAGHPVAILSRRVETATLGPQMVLDVTGENGEAERWVVDGPCGCGSPSKRWGRAELLALVDARARAGQ